MTRTAFMRHMASEALAQRTMFEGKEASVALAGDNRGSRKNEEWCGWTCSCTTAFLFSRSRKVWRVRGVCEKVACEVKWLRRGGVEFVIWHQLSLAGCRWEVAKANFNFMPLSFDLPATSTIAPAIQHILSYLVGVVHGWYM
jgi:hypothetical protein